VTRHPKNPRGCKIGSMPSVVCVDGRCKVEVGKVIRVRDFTHGSKWFPVRVTHVEKDGYFKAERR
jgi:hypothetical protein